MAAAAENTRMDPLLMDLRITKGNTNVKHEKKRINKYFSLWLIFKHYSSINLYR